MLTIPKATEFQTYKSGKFYFFTTFDIEKISCLIRDIYTAYKNMINISLRSDEMANIISSNIRQSIFCTAAIEGNPLGQDKVNTIIDNFSLYGDDNNDSSVQEILNLKYLYEHIYGYQ